MGMSLSKRNRSRFTDFLHRPKAAEHRKWAVASDDRLERMEQKRMEREKENAKCD